MTEAETLTLLSVIDVAADASPHRPDYELAQCAAHGDMQAFEQLYELYHRRVYGLCLRMTQNVAEAEDLTQEVFIKLYRKIGSYRGESSFTTWLHRLTINQVLMRFRKRNARKEEQPLEGEAAGRNRAAWASNQVSMTERVALDKAIAKLPPGYRAVFLLHDLLGHEHEEIAQLMGCAVGTSKSQLHKARMKLRQLLRTTRPSPDSRPR
jgi:RNA polymerase sigma-70 factor, ECF subfamily